MLVTELYNGQGFGNQLACYVATRVFARDHSYRFGIMHPERFKGLEFMDLDFGERVIGGSGPEGGPPSTLPEGIIHYYRERALFHPSGADIRLYDSDLVSVPDNTKIDGLMQDEQYIVHRKEEIRGWLKVKESFECSDYADDNTCVINFRGGEYVRHKDFFLEKKYWEDAIEHMRRINPRFRFIVITDDVFTAKKFFPKFDVFHFSIGKDYVIIKNAHYLILSNSSFAWFAAWLSKELKFCIAPKYWGRHNVSDGYWSLGYNITSGWHYLDRDGKLCDYETCLKEFTHYQETNPTFFLKSGGEKEIYSLGSYKRKGKIIASVYEKVSRPSQAVKTILKRKLPLSVLRALRACIYRVRNIIFLSKQFFNSFKNTPKEAVFLPKQEILEYKKTIRVYDLFYLFNELDLLEIRLNILDEYVDYFVIIECTQSFSGRPHELQYPLYKDRYAKWRDKIIYYVVDDFPNDKDLLDLATRNSNVGAGEHYWVREFYQKESAKKALTNLKDDDVVFISDLDEIWNPRRLKELTDFSKSEIIRPKQLSYYYYLNNRSSEEKGWTGTVVLHYSTLKHSCLNDLRTRSKTKYREVQNGGWHFGFLGGVKGAVRKLSTWQHPAYEDWVSTIEERVKKNVDYRGRAFKFWTDESDLPEYLKENKEQYKDLFK